MNQSELQYIYLDMLDKYSGNSGHKKGQRKALRSFYIALNNYISSK